MDEQKRSPILDYNMIMSRSDLFSSLECYDKALREYKQNIRGKCGNCITGMQKLFAQQIRDELVEKKMIHVFKQMEPNTIVRYGSRILRASELT